LNYVSGDVFVQRTSDLGYEKGEINLALVQEKQGKNKQSMENLERAVKINPQNEIARKLLKKLKGVS